MSIYRGRFAPSPTGPLHFGSLVAAVSSYLDARCNQGEWLVRMEDLDPPREIAGAADAILRSLDALGFEWDGPVVYQSQRSPYYDDALAALEHSGHSFGCVCTRKEITDSSMVTGTGSVYPGTCRSGIPTGRSVRSTRVQVYNKEITVEDRLQDALTQQLGNQVGDFIIKRADQLHAYQLAVVVDDAAQDITHIVRGIDLFASTPRQIHLQQLLDYPLPSYLHIAVAVNADNEKLSKQTHAQAINTDNWSRLVCDALVFLNQALPDSVEDASKEELWQWAIDHWDTAALPATHSILAARDYFAS